jgi:lactate dehydrogenase-like 2-hydroxyacid dehydrogenase
MRVAILDDVHGAYDGTTGIRRIREAAEVVRIFTSPFGEPSVLRGFDALVANRERTRFTRTLLKQLPDLRIIAQTGNHAYHIDLAAAAECGVIVAKAAGGFSTGAGELTIGRFACFLLPVKADVRATLAPRLTAIRGVYTVAECASSGMKRNVVET